MAKIYLTKGFTMAKATKKTAAKTAKKAPMKKVTAKKAPTKKVAAKTATVKVARATTINGRNPIALTLGQAKKIQKKLKNIDFEFNFLDEKIISVTA